MATSIHAITRPMAIGATGIALFGLGLMALFGMSSVVTNIVYSHITLRPNSQSLPIWKDIPVPLFESFYFFNITNPDEVERFAAKPILEEIGPFTYRLYLNKTAIKFNPNGTVTYREIKTWKFLRDKSVADESTIVTTLNGPLALTLTLIQHASPAVRTIVSLALEALTEGFFIKRSIRQLLFEGYPDTLTTFAPLLNPEITSFSSGRFAWLIGKNGTDDGIYNVWTGTTDIDKLTVIDRYENKSALPYWLSDECNSFDGATVGEMRPPLKHRQKSVKIFHPDLCRTLELDFNKTYANQDTDGLTAVRFIINKDTFKNLTDYPPNGCYDTKLFYPENQPGAGASPLQARLRNIFNLRRQSQAAALSSPIRFPSGVFDISKCKFGMPILVSQPHFLNADSSLRRTVYGMRPNASRHDFFMDIEPETGSTIFLAARVQINVAINKGPGIRYRNIPNIVFPVFWQEMMMESDPAIANQLWLAQNAPELAAHISGYSLFTLGSLMCLAALLIPLLQLCKQAKASISETTSKRNGANEKTVRTNSQDDNKNILNRQQSTDTIGVDNPVQINE